MRERHCFFPEGKITIWFIAAAIILFSGCTEDPTFLGKNILPTSDNIVIRHDTSFVINAWTTPGKPVITNDNRICMLGSRRDEIFGYERARFMTPIINNFNTALGSSLEVDSLIVALAVDGSYGNSTAQTVRVYEVTQDSIGYHKDPPYYSNDDPSVYYNPVELGNTSFRPSSDSIIRIKVTNQDYLDKFVNAPDSVFEDPVDFMNTFKGIFVATDPVAGDGGGMLAINLDAVSDSLGRLSSMKLYFKNSSISAGSDSNLIYTIYFPTIDPHSSATTPIYYSRPDFYEHDYTGSRAAEFLDQPGAGDSIQFISGNAGLNVRLSFPEIQKWLDSTNIAINKAELIVPADTTVINQSNFPQQLNLMMVKDDDTYSFLDDMLIDPSYTNSTGQASTFNGYYNSIMRGAYVFNIGYHFQRYIDGQENFMNFVLINGDLSNIRKATPQTLNASSATRTILKSPGPSGIRLHIIYTEY